MSEYAIKTPGGTIIVGPGTVPTSGASVSGTIITDMISKLKKASKDKIYEDKEDYDFVSLGRTSR